MPKQFCVYILASDKNGTLYIGVTSNLTQRIWQHKNKVVDGFTKNYDVNKLVYYEVHETVESTLRREKRLKFWQRNWKKDLIESFNPQWKDLYNEIAISV